MRHIYFSFYDIYHVATCMYMYRMVDRKIKQTERFSGLQSARFRCAIKVPKRHYTLRQNYSTQCTDGSPH